MGNSIAFGVSNILEKTPNTSGILIALVDQPLISLEHFQNLISQQQGAPHQIHISANEKGKWSPPSLFGSTYFQKLMNLDGDKGAQSIIAENKLNVSAITCFSSLEDADTPEEYQQMLDCFNHQS